MLFDPIYKAMKEHPCYTLGAVAAIAFIALATAFASEAFLGLEPCKLCIYQRWPFAIVILLGIIGLTIKALRRPALFLSGLAMLVNSGIALYHSGVEQKWWKSAFEGCSVPSAFLNGDKTQSILENIMSAPTARCDEIPWQDPILGLSMANYNILLCFALFIVCALGFWLSRNTKQIQPGQETENEN